MLTESEKRLVVAQREVNALTVGSTPSCEAISLLVHQNWCLRHEDEFIAEMVVQLHRGHAEMNIQTAEAVDDTVTTLETEVANLKAGIARVELGRGAFLNSLVNAMNEF